MPEFLDIGKRIVPANFGPLRGANGNARVSGPCGDTMEFWLRVGEDDFVEASSFTTDGCGYSQLCGSVAAAMAAGASLDVIDRFSQDDVLTMAGDVPEESRHCALLAVNTLRAAAADYCMKKQLSERSTQ